MILFGQVYLMDSDVYFYPFAFKFKSVNDAASRLCRGSQMDGCDLQNMRITWHIYSTNLVSTNKSCRIIKEAMYQLGISFLAI